MVAFLLRFLFWVSDYEPDDNETATITASSPVVLTEDTNVVVAAG